MKRKKQKGIAERKTEIKRKKNVPYKSVGLGIVLWLSVTWLFFGRGTAPRVTYQKGQIIPTTVEAKVDFSCKNLQDTELAREQATESIPLLFNLDPAPRSRAGKKVQTVFDRMAELAEAPQDEKGAKAASLGDLLLGSDIEDTKQFIDAFAADEIDKVKSKVLQGIQKVMSVGIMSDETRETFSQEDPERAISIRTGEDTPARQESLKNIYSRRQAVWSITKQIRNDTQRDLLDRLLFSVVEDNLSYDKAETESLRKAAADAVEPVMEFYPATMILVRAGDLADDQNLLVLNTHNQETQSARDTAELAIDLFGNAVLLLIGLIATAVFLRIGNSTMIRQIEKLLLMMILSLLTLGTASLLSYLGYHQTLISPSMVAFLVPHALAVLLAGILLGSGAALCLGFWNSFAIAILLDQSFLVFGMGIVVTITAASTARNVHRRASLFRAGLWICAAKMLYVLLLAVINQQEALSGLAIQLGCAVLSAVLSSVLTLLLIPVFEKLFKITTDITLLELSDMGHPLLQKMAMQAPGTYHHSLMVATLAQNAAEAVGANSLLVRVCAYYHDIGKMAKPEFFTENIQHKENPHDELSPHMSALVISSHVKEGLTLAKRYKLPQPILDAIEQHHGNGLISFFYHKAKQQAGDGSTSMVELINESDFRYGGAPAVTPEMAILSLADASEAAARSIEKPTPQKISNMLDDIFSMKIRDGQMDYANLTMAQIKVVKQSFIFSLSNMLHGRVAYPKMNENKHPKPAKESSDTDSAAAKAD